MLIGLSEKEAGCNVKMTDSGEIIIYDIKKLED